MELRTNERRQAMKAARLVLFVLIGMSAAGAATAQQHQPAGRPLGFGGQIGTLGPAQAPSQPRPLFSIFGVPVAIWAPLPAPYNVAANRNLAARPIE
jgi:hypothetical protein